MALTSSFGGDMRASSSAGISPSSASHAENRRTASWRDRAVAASAPASSSDAIQVLTVDGVKSDTCAGFASHQDRNARAPSP